MVIIAVQFLALFIFGADFNENLLSNGSARWNVKQSNPNIYF